MQRLIVLVILIACACKAGSPGSKERKCPSIPSNGYKYVELEKFPILDGQDTLYVNSISFYCVYTAMLSKKSMYDKYGLWSSLITPNDDIGKVLVWENVQLFEDDPSSFTVAAYGVEDYGYISTSFVILDKNGQDAIADMSEVTRFKNELSELIRKNDRADRMFFPIFFSEVNPDAWKNIQKKQGNQKQN